jgi:hypothetical protein
MAKMSPVNGETAADFPVKTSGLGRGACDRGFNCAWRKKLVGDGSHPAAAMHPKSVVL